MGNPYLKDVYFVVVNSAEYFVQMTKDDAKYLRSLVRRFGGTVTRLHLTDIGMLSHHLMNS